jgi:putative FmdB family regulatory protein
VCTNCGYDFERVQAYSADPVTVCPRCAGKVRRRISPVGVIFKGSGWYITDSKRQLSGGTAKAGRQLGGGQPGEAAAAAAAAGDGDSPGASSKDDGAAGPGASAEQAEAGKGKEPGKTGKSAKPSGAKTA